MGGRCGVDVYDNTFGPIAVAVLINGNNNYPHIFYFFLLALSLF